MMSVSKSEGSMECIMDLDSVDRRGEPIIIRNTPCVRDANGEVYLDPDEVMKARLKGFAEVTGIEDRDIWLFLLLYAKLGPFQRGDIFRKYKLNKMLFYISKEMEKEGFKNATVHDEFEADKRGPVPENLWNDLERLHDQGLINCSNEGKNVKQPVEVTLTKEGEEIAKQLWNDFPDIILEDITKVKEWIFPLTDEQLKERVHKDYPEYISTYIENDSE